MLCSAALGLLSCGLVRPFVTWPSRWPCFLTRLGSSASSVADPRPAPGPSSLQTSLGAGRQHQRACAEGPADGGGLGRPGAAIFRLPRGVRPEADASPAARRARRPSRSLWLGLRAGSGRVFRPRRACAAESPSPCRAVAFVPAGAPGRWPGVPAQGARQPPGSSRHCQTHLTEAQDFI